MQGPPMRRHFRRPIGQRRDPVDGAAAEALGAYDRALVDLARIDRAEAITHRRLVAMEEMILACREAMDAPTQDQEDMRRALDGLLEDLVKMEETLPIERAFLADERDRAMMQIRGIRNRLPTQEAEGFWGLLHRIAPNVVEQPARIGLWVIPALRDARLT